MTLDQQYPSSSPAISIHNPRGLSDDKLSSVQKCLQLKAQSCLGSPVLYQLIEKAKEILTESNIPHGNCVICLFGFKDGEVFTKTSCYHYFHCHCLGRYVSHSESELRQREKELEEDKTRDRTDRQELSVVCPVCREPLTYDVDQLLACPPPRLPELDEAAISSSFQQRWCELQKVLERQRSKGGLIDPEEESNRFLIHVNETPDLDVDVSLTPPLPSSSTGPADETAFRADRSVPGLSYCRGGQSQRRQNPVRGPRRGGRSTPHHRRASPITEQLDKLSLSSDRTAKAEGNRGQQRPVKTGEDTEPQESPVSPEDGSGVRAALETERADDTADSASGRGPRGRRRGPHRPVPHNRAPWPTHHHWDRRAARSRGGRPRGGPGRGLQHSVVERGREEVL